MRRSRRKGGLPLQAERAVHQQLSHRRPFEPLAMPRRFPVTSTRRVSGPQLQDRPGLQPEARPGDPAGPRGGAHRVGGRLAFGRWPATTKLGGRPARTPRTRSSTSTSPETRSPGARPFETPTRTSATGPRRLSPYRRAPLSTDASRHTAPGTCHGSRSLDSPNAGDSPWTSRTRTEAPLTC